MNLPAPTTLSSNLDRAHFQEWLDSGVSPEIILENVASLSGESPYDYLIYSDNIDRRRDGRVRDWVLRRYRHVEDGGWWCSGEDLVELKKAIVERRIADHADEAIQFNMMWGQFKPNTPFVGEDGKPQKYEAPPKTETRSFVPRDPDNARFWLEVLSCPTFPIVITEGAKKAGCLFSLGYAAIALPGVFSGHRKETRRLIEDMAVLCAPGRPIYICFDTDSKQTTRQYVDKAIAQLGRLFTIAGCIVKVIVLPGPEKGVDDFVVARGRAAFDEQYENALLLPHWETRRYAQLSYPASIVLNQDKLGAFSILGNPNLIAIKSAKGTGKTEFLVSMVERALQNGQWVLLVGHRVQLVQAICKRIGLDYVTEVHKSEMGTLLGYGLCIDSLHPNSQARFNAEGWKDGVVILDESEQVIWHTLSADTEVNKHRIAVLNQLKALLKNVLTSENGKVVLLDADLSDLSIDFIRGLADSQTPPWICLNEWKPEQGWKIYHYEDPSPAKIYAALEGKIAAGVRVIVHTHAQSKKAKWGTCALEGTLAKRFPDQRILRIDSKTVADPSHPACGCIDKLNEILGQYDIVICSPSIETGVSIDIRGHFGAVFGIFQGVTTADSARQTLARLREPVERHVWLAKRGLESVGNGATSFKSILAAQHKLAQINIRRLQEVCLEIGEETIDFNNTALNIWAKMAVRINAGMVKYRETVIAGLTAEGHQILSAKAPQSNPEEALERIIETQQANLKAEREGITEAPKITHSQYEKLKDKKEKIEMEHHQERKHFLEERYGIEVTPDLIEKDDAGWHSKIRLHYYLSVGNSFLKQRDKRYLEASIQEGSAWLPTLNKSQLGAVIAVFEFLGIKNFLIEGETFSNAHPELLKMFEIAKREWWAIKAIINLSIGEKDTPITFLTRLLGKIGIKLSFDHKEGGVGQQQRIYRYEGVDDGRADVFGRWLERDHSSERLAAEEAAESQAIVTGGKYKSEAA